ncbi:MAG: L-dopachrome tautomerase-related protein [Candidatus Neomarinimicrobiota bacterium]
MNNYRIWVAVSVLAGLLAFSSCTGDGVGLYSMEEVAHSQRQWTGVAVSQEGRLFVSYPRWRMDLTFSVVEITADGLEQPYPNEHWNSWTPADQPADYFVCVQSVYVDRDNYLWLLDPGLDPARGILEGGSKLIKVDLQTDSIVQIIAFDRTVAPQNSYLNDVRVDTRREFAYITDSGLGAIVAVNLATGESRRFLDGHPATQAEDITLVIEGQPWQRPDGSTPKIHSDGLALDDHGDLLYFQALTGYTLYRIPSAMLRDWSLTVEDRGAEVEELLLVGASDAIEFGPGGYLYFTSIEHNAVRRLTPDRQIEMVVQDERLKWPDSFAITAKGEIYVTTSQIHLGPEVTDPYRVFKLTPKK